jgi:low affinity Fe/Cu permease
VHFDVAGIEVGIWVRGRVLHYSDFWQLIANTDTNIVTFLMVSLIQSTQNRDARAINLKLDELIRAVDNARNHMIIIEKLSHAELDLLEDQFTRLRSKHELKREPMGMAAD